MSAVANCHWPWAQAYWQAQDHHARRWNYGTRFVSEKVGHEHNRDRPAAGYLARRFRRHQQVMLAVNNEAICRIIYKKAGYGCDDMPAIDRQIQVAKDLAGPALSGWQTLDEGKIKTSIQNSKKENHHGNEGTHEWMGWIGKALGPRKADVVATRERDRRAGDGILGFRTGSDSGGRSRAGMQ